MNITSRLPEFATHHMAIVGRTGAGKTFAAKGIVEALIATQRRVIVLDPTGAWYGLASKRDGSPGLPVRILGGEHGGAPLATERAGQLGEWLAQHGGATVLDLSEMLIGERHRFVEEFAGAIYRFNKSPLHLVIDEADEFAPQNPLPETRRMLHRIDQIVRRGRIKGFRVMLITQRPAVIHKNVLTQANTLIAMRLTAPQDRKAIEAWVEGNADAGQAKAVMGSLARLQRGEGWVWAPEHDVLERVTFPAISSFDSSRAPEDGEEMAQPQAMTVDYAPLRALLEVEAVPSRAANISKHSVAPTVDIGQQLKAAEQAGYERGYQAGARAGYEAGWGDAWQQIQAAIEKARTAPAHAPPEAAATSVPERVEQLRNYEEAEAIRERVPRTADGGRLSKAERLVLTALAQYPAGRSRTQVAILTGYASSGGGFNNALSSLRTKQWIDGAGDLLRITGEGRKALGPFTPLPRGRALLQHWLGQLSKAERKALEELASVYPRTLSKEQLAHRAGYEPNGGGFNNALSRLRTLELIRGSREIKASEDLFG